jgi:hypothetical protein
MLPAMSFVAPILALALLTPVAGASRAKEAKEGWVFIVRADESIAATWTDELRGAAQAATKKKNIRYVKPPEISTKEVELALGCQGWTATCAGQVATMLNANATLTIDIVQRGRGAWLSMELVGADGAVRGERTRHELPDRAESGLRAAKAFLTARITGVPVTGLVVDTDSPGADVSVDGAPAGKTPLALYDVKPGAHRIVITHPEKADVVREITVPAGEIAKVAVVLVSPLTTSAIVTPPATAPTTSNEQASGAPMIPPTLAYGVLAGGGSLVALALVSGAANIAVILSHLYYDGFDTQKSYMSRRVFGSDENASAVSFATGIGFYVVGAIGLVVTTVGAVLLGVSLADSLGAEEGASSSTEGAPSPAGSPDPSLSDDDAAAPVSSSGT